MKNNDFKGKPVEDLNKAFFYLAHLFFEMGGDKDTLEETLRHAAKHYSTGERYFEVWFDTTPPTSICIKGFSEPTILEAQKFCEDYAVDVARIAKVYNVDEISFDEACKYFDMQTVDEWPTFGQKKRLRRQCRRGT